MRLRSLADDGEVASWTGEHDGYRPAVHRRSVRLDRAARVVEITDEISGGPHDVRVAFHLGPDVAASLTSAAGGDAPARWPRWRGRTR